MDAGSRPEARSPDWFDGQARVRHRTDREGQPVGRRRGIRAASDAGSSRPRRGSVGGCAGRPIPDADPARDARSDGPADPLLPSGDAAVPRWLRAAEPPSERLPPLLHDRLARCDPDPGSAPAQGADPPGRQRVALSAARRRPYGAGLCQRRLPHAAVQPVRLLRGRSESRVTRSRERGAPADPGAVRPDDPDLVRAYEAALAALAERGRFGIRLGLGRTRALLRELGDPQLGLRGSLVAGTNGKGSVLALAGAALRAAGLRAGETPKPHLVSYRERLQIGGRPVDTATFARLVQAAIAAAGRLPRRLGEPTEFELLTAVVFEWFAEQGIDVA